MVWLVRVDGLSVGQSPLGNLERTTYFRDPLVLERFGQHRQIVGAQGRIATTDQNQVASHHAARHAAGRDQPGFKAVCRSQSIQRIKGRHRLGDTGRGQSGRAVQPFKTQSRLGIRNRKADLTIQLCRRDNLFAATYGLLEMIRPAQRRPQRHCRRRGQSGLRNHTRRRGQKPTSRNHALHARI